MTFLAQSLRPFLGTGFCVAALAICRSEAADPKQALPAANASTAPVAVAGVPFDTFRPIADRNIFDPNRVGRTSRSTRTEVARPTGDTIALVGTMHYEKGYFAFFDSTDAKYRIAVHEGEPIAEFKVSSVSAEGVELGRNGKNLSLKVAQKLRRPIGEDWTVAADEPGRDDASATAAASSDTSLTQASAPPPIPADASETLKRLMEQRRKQLKE